MLSGHKEFDGFLNIVGAEVIDIDVVELIKETYKGKICQHVELNSIVNQSSCALAYALALIDTTDYRSITPRWVLYNYPEVEYIIKKLRYTICEEGCLYCNTYLDIHKNLKAFFVTTSLELMMESHCKRMLHKLL